MVRKQRIALAFLAWVIMLPSAYAQTVELEKVREWESPLGVSVIRYQVRVNDVPVHARHFSQLRDRNGNVVMQSGMAGDLAESLERARLTIAAPHPQPATTLEGSFGGPLDFVTYTDVWQATDEGLAPAYVENTVNLEKAGRPVARQRLVHAASGELLGEFDMIREFAPQGFHVYAQADGRPQLSPYGDSWPHPVGDAYTWSPSDTAAQSTVMQESAAVSLTDPWLANDATATAGNNVIAFFNSLIEDDGTVGDPFNSPSYGPMPDAAEGDFLSTTNSGADFVYGYDPTGTGAEYFQAPGESMSPPDPADSALNAKIVQAFYSVNWLHDFFYAAGFDEMAGNAQAGNLGRGGMDGDPHIVFAGYPLTISSQSPDGTSPVLWLGLNGYSSSSRGASMDFSIVAHEWGHFLIDRTANVPNGVIYSPQGNALHEGIADFIALLVGVDSGDDFNGAFPVGQYFNSDYVHPPWLPNSGVSPDSWYYGIRRYPYSLDFEKNPLLFSNLVEAPQVPHFDWKGRGAVLHEAHTAGEIFAQALLQCFGGIVEANEGVPFEDIRLRMAQYLVAGLMMFPEYPTFLEARNALLGVIRAVDAADMKACRSGFAARGMGAGAVGPDREIEEFDVAMNGFLDQDHKMKIVSLAVNPVEPCGDCTPDDSTTRAVIAIDVVNRGMVDAERVVFRIAPSVPDAVQFPDGDTASLAGLAPGGEGSMKLPMVIDASGLPANGGDSDYRILEFNVTVHVDGAGEAAGDESVGFYEVAYSESSDQAAPEGGSDGNSPGDDAPGANDGAGGSNGGGAVFWLPGLALCRRLARRRLRAVDGSSHQRQAEAACRVPSST